MIVLFWSRATRDLLKSFGWGIAATPSVRCSDEVATFPRRPPHSIFRYRGRRPASGRSLHAQRVETDAAKREFGSGSCLFAPPWGGGGGLGGSLCFPFPTPGNGQQEPAGADRAPSSPSSPRCASNRMLPAPGCVSRRS